MIFSSMFLSRSSCRRGGISLCTCGTRHRSKWGQRREGQATTSWTWVGTYGDPCPYQGCRTKLRQGQSQRPDRSWGTNSSFPVGRLRDDVSCRWWDWSTGQWRWKRRRLCGRCTPASYARCRSTLVHKNLPSRWCRGSPRIVWGQRVWLARTRSPQGWQNRRRNLKSSNKAIKSEVKSDQIFNFGSNKKSSNKEIIKLRSNPKSNKRQVKLESFQVKLLFNGRCFICKKIKLIVLQKCFTLCFLGLQCKYSPKLFISHNYKIIKEVHGITFSQLRFV